MNFNFIYLFRHRVNRSGRKYPEERIRIFLSFVLFVGAEKLKILFNIPLI